ncbi:MAG TPA: carboxymuconolactone decarboxylase family protein [Phenylobacterium sp.]|nr:carboxymuconolactone decarboxylase family protein [Phenylobacterium sp.]
MSRLNPWIAAPEAMNQLVEFSMAQARDSVEESLQHLIKIRASQINGCAVCLHMHTAEARKHGESEARIYLLDAWHEAGVFTAREKAALAWADALTRLSETRAPDEAYDAVTAEFTDEEVVKLTMLINAINAFNRFGVGFRSPPIGLKKAA